MDHLIILNLSLGLMTFHGKKCKINNSKPHIIHQNSKLKHNRINY